MLKYKKLIFNDNIIGHIQEILRFNYTILNVELTLFFTIEVKFETDSVYSGMAYPGYPV
jgi:hypothetical protein